MSSQSVISPNTVPLMAQRRWQEELQQAIRSPEVLLEQLGLPLDVLPEALRAADDFALRVPLPFVAKMRRGDISDPLLRQVLPVGAELKPVAGYGMDPLAELTANPLKGLIHKYQNRVLLTLASACAVNCRYCFRRHFPYGENNPGRDEWRKVLDYIASDEQINEVIFSGGDPLLVSDRQLSGLVSELEKLDHVKRLRIHTRLPVVIPERVDEEFLRWLDATSLQTVMVMHINHPAEIDGVLAEKVSALKSVGVTVLNQAVLLKGVNDSADTLVSLSETLFDAGILPYYLHLLDKTAGVAHFDCDEEQALELFAAMQARLSGFLVPRLVREIPDKSSKTLIY